MIAVPQDKWTAPQSMLRMADEYGHNLLYWTLCDAHRRGDTALISRLESCGSLAEATRLAKAAA